MIAGEEGITRRITKITIPVTYASLCSTLFQTHVWSRMVMTLRCLPRAESQAGLTNMAARPARPGLARVLMMPTTTKMTTTRTMMMTMMTVVMVAVAPVGGYFFPPGFAHHYTYSSVHTMSTHDNVSTVLKVSKATTSSKPARTRPLNAFYFHRVTFFPIAYDFIYSVSNPRWTNIHPVNYGRHSNDDRGPIWLAKKVRIALGFVLSGTKGRHNELISDFCLSVFSSWFCNCLFFCLLVYGCISALLFIWLPVFVVWLYVCLPTFMSLCLHVCLPVHLPAFVYACLFICLPLSYFIMFVCPPFCPSACLSACLLSCLSVGLSVFSVCLYVLLLFAILPVCLFIFWTVHVCHKSTLMQEKSVFLVFFV